MQDQAIFEEKAYHKRWS